ncbi:MAG: hypothetical protein ACRDYE_00790 [Acidimicrobiales bacterium]
MAGTAFFTAAFFGTGAPFLLVVAFFVAGAFRAGAGRLALALGVGGAAFFAARGTFLGGDRRPDPAGLVGADRAAFFAAVTSTSSRDSPSPDGDPSVRPRGGRPPAGG